MGVGAWAGLRHTLFWRNYQAELQWCPQMAVRDDGGPPQLSRSIFWLRIEGG